MAMRGQQTARSQTLDDRQVYGERSGQPFITNPPRYYPESSGARVSSPGLIQEEVQWENDASGYTDFPTPRPSGLYAQQNHSSPALASHRYPSSSSNGQRSASPQQSQDASSHPVPSVDDINLSLESMRFEQRDPNAQAQQQHPQLGYQLRGGAAPGGGARNPSPNDSIASIGIGRIGQDGAMEIMGREGVTASVYSLDSSYGYNGTGIAGPSSGQPQQHARRTSNSSTRTYGRDDGAAPVDGYYAEERPHSGSSYLPYDDPTAQYGQPNSYPATGQQPYYSDPASTSNSYYPANPSASASSHHPQPQLQQPGLPAHPRPQYHQPPSFQPQPQHGGWGYEYSAAAAQNPYYAAATGQLGFPQGQGPLHRAMSSASSLQGGGLARSVSSINLNGGQGQGQKVGGVAGGGMRRNGTVSSNGSGSKGGPPITKQSVDEYRARIKADPDPEAQFNFAKYLIEAAKKISSAAPEGEKAAKKYRDALLAESLKLIKRLATQGTGLGKPAYADAQFFLANCLGNGSLGLQVDHEKAYNLYVQASKQNHSSATYRTAVCNEVGAGTRRDHARAVLFYRKASALGDTAGMYKLGMILLNGLLGQQKNAKEAFAWLKRAALQADEDNPHALHELGLLYEKATPPGQGPPSVVPYDPAQARELFTQAGQFGYPPSMFKLGALYEYGTLTCQVDPRRSIAWYTRAAGRGDAESELALSGWYLTGSEGVLKQSDSEAYLWARRAANKGLPKAEYAVGYYSEVGIGVKQDLEEAKRWYMRAAAQGNKRAMQRLTELKKLSNANSKKPVTARPTRKEAETECVIM